MSLYFGCVNELAVLRGLGPIFDKPAFTGGDGRRYPGQIQSLHLRLCRGIQELQARRQAVRDLRYEAHVGLVFEKDAVPDEPAVRRIDARLLFHEHLWLAAGEPAELHDAHVARADPPVVMAARGVDHIDQFVPRVSYIQVQIWQAYTAQRHPPGSS